jgi:hypothetical protein
LVAILTVDRDTSLQELRAETGERLPGEVVQALVGEAFNRLERSPSRSCRLWPSMVCRCRRSASITCCNRP